jgi:hypothetical protein
LTDSLSATGAIINGFAFRRDYNLRRHAVSIIMWLGEKSAFDQKDWTWENFQTFLPMSTAPLN